MDITPIFLAAGNSKRFGANKLLTPLADKPLYRHGLDALLTVCAQGVLCPPVLVTQYDAIAQQVEDLPLTVVRNPDPARGIASSVICGVHATNPAHALLFLTADQPYLTAQTLCAFVQGYRESGQPLACVAHGTRTGNPTLFAPSYRQDLLALTGDIGGKSILKRQMHAVYTHQTPEKELLDIDWQAQL